MKTRIAASLLAAAIWGCSPPSDTDAGVGGGTGGASTGGPQLLARWRDTNVGGRRLYYVRYE